MFTGRSEFYDKALALGFYGNEESGLTGKKDNVRKFWEEISIKVYCRFLIEKNVDEGRKFSVLDMGSGTGEGYRLLTHIPPTNPKDAVEKEFLISPKDIKKYVGIESERTLIDQTKLRYRNRDSHKFLLGDTANGLPNSALELEPFDIYFSAFSSLSHLTPEQMENLLTQIFSHSKKGSVVFFEVFGKYSPEWPGYWSKQEVMLPYTFGYLIPAEERKKENIEWFLASFWSPEALKSTIKSAEQRSGRKVKLTFMTDRSVFVGRHMDTGLLSSRRVPIRFQVNRLFDHGYRGETKHLEINMSHLKHLKLSHPEVWNRLFQFQINWNRVIYILGALVNHKDTKIKKFIEDADKVDMSDDLKFLVWLFRNADRFPVADFWSSVLGPQVAVALRNIEMSYTEGLGCGHGLMCGMEVIK